MANPIQESMDAYRNGQLDILSGPTATFNFGCNQCGQCCVDNMIMVSPWDVVRMSEALKIPAAQVLNTYLDINIGQTSHLPVATLAMYPIPKTPIKCCAFLTVDGATGKCKCAIQKDKPLICAIFPLGRVNQVDKGTGKRKMEYFCQKVNCKADTTVSVTLQDWLNQYNIAGSEQASDDWTDFIVNAPKVINLEMLDDGTDLGCDYRKKEVLYNYLITSLYGSYIPHGTTDSVAETKKILTNSLTILEKAVAMEPGLASLGDL